MTQRLDCSRPPTAGRPWHLIWDAVKMKRPTSITSTRDSNYSADWRPTDRATNSLNPGSISYTTASRSSIRPTRDTRSWSKEEGRVAAAV